MTLSWYDRRALGAATGDEADAVGMAREMMAAEGRAMAEAMVAPREATRAPLESILMNVMVCGFEGYEKKEAKAAEGSAPVLGTSSTQISAPKAESSKNGMASRPMIGRDALLTDVASRYLPRAVIKRECEA
jgi:hypothetical protein